MLNNKTNINYFIQHYTVNTVVSNLTDNINIYVYNVFQAKCLIDCDVKRNYNEKNSVWMAGIYC